MIRTFRDKSTETIFNNGRSRKLPPEIHRRAKRKLLLVDAASSLDDLKVPPGNKLEKLAGDLQDKWSIRINQQWRICFEWNEGDAFEVQITDYHD